MNENQQAQSKPDQKDQKKENNDAKGAKDQKENQLIEGQQEEEELEQIMLIDEYYPDNHIEKEIEDTSISRRNQKFYGCYGMQSFKRYNINYLEDNVVIYNAGNTYHILNIDTKDKRIYHGKDTDGIGSISVHPSRKYFAVAEKGDHPNIYIYEYPSMKLYRILKKGTEKTYTHVEFSVSGTKLASIGGKPDYTLTVWDWLSQKVILKAKAFSQDVFRASFSPFTDDTLFTSGNGHIRFWRMAKTFTGLKLQGEIGKFGQLELSDVTGLAELPDGKVISGTEYGTLILWEGNLIKAHLVLDEQLKTPLHNGMIEQVILDGDHFITAGGDGYIKWWKFADIDNAEADETLEICIQPVQEKLIRDVNNNGEPAYIVNMIKGKDHWLVVDGKGKIWKMKNDTQEINEIIHFHSGSLNDLAVSQKQNAVITVGQDGEVKLWDFIKQQEFYSRKFLGKATCVDLLGYAEANQGRVFAVGFDNGIVRILMMGNQELTILKAFKAHDQGIAKVKYSPDLTMLVSASENGEIFFYQISGQDDIQKYEPLCMITLPEGAIVNDLRWDSQSAHVLVGCKNGRVYEIRTPKANEIDNTETFLVDNIPIREWKMKMMEFQMKKNQKKDEEEEEKKRRMRLRGELPKEEQEEEEDWNPEQILSCSYLNDGSGRFIVSSEGPYSGYYYICDFGNERPLKAIAIPKDSVCNVIDISPQGDLLALGFSNGEVQIRSFEKPEKFMSIKMHDAQQGQITSIKFDSNEKFVLTSSTDGLMFAHQIDKENILREALFDPLEDVENLDYIPEDQKKEISEEKLNEFLKANPPQFEQVDVEKECLEPTFLSKDLKITEEINEDIIDPSQYSIQQAKLRTEEDHRLQLAEEKKENVKERIKKLRKAFKELTERNLTTEEWIKLTEDEFNIDPQYFDMLQDRNRIKVEEAKKEVAWNIEYHTLRLNKLKSKFYDVLEFEKFTVKAIKTGNFVTTFRVSKISEFLQKNIEAFKLMLEQEMQGNNALGEFDEDMDNLDLSNLNQTKEESKKLDPTQTKSLLNNKAKQQGTQQHKTEAEKKREERKLQREARKKKIEKLEKKIAIHSAEDPEDKKEIELALQTFGDYKLKLSSNYIVPENQRVNFAKKRQQMILLEGSIHKLKVDFNKKIQELKLRKREIIDRVKKLNFRLGDINTDLGEQVELFEPKIDEIVEYPERFFDVTDNDIEQFKKTKLERERAAAAAKKTNLMGSKKQQQVVQEDQVNQNQIQQPLTEAQQQAEAKAAQNKVLDDKKKFTGAERKGKKIQESELDEEMKQIRKIELCYEKDQVNSEIESLINNFDEEIKEMQKEKYRLESDLKNAEMKLILFFEELILLNSMEGKDQELTKRLSRCRQEKGQILKEINEISKKLKEKKKEIDEIKIKEENLMVKFHELCPEGSDKYDDIRKFFEKITKRRKNPKEKQGKQGQGEDDEEEEEEEEFEEEDEEEDEDENNVVSLPQEEYKIDEIEKLREDRLELYEDKEKILQFINGLEMDRKKLENKEKNIKLDLEETEEEIQDFQKEKMAKLNQLDISIVLKVKQLQNLEPNSNMIEKWAKIREKELERKQQELQQQQNSLGENANQTIDEEQRLQLLEEEDYRGFFLPKDLKNSILFTRTQLLQLIYRKKELDEEQINLDKAFKDYKKDSHQKKKEIKENEKVRSEKEKEYNERQMLRFGNLVDLDNLEISGPSNVVLDLQNKFSKTEKKCIKMIEEADGELENTQRDLTQSIKNNTNLLNLIRQLGEELLDLNRKLDSTNKAIFVDEDDEDKKKSVKEKENLKRFLELQAKEVETLKTEINLYKKKGGHIYTKVTTNRRVANLNQNDQ